MKRVRGRGIKTPVDRRRGAGTRAAGATFVGIGMFLLSRVLGRGSDAFAFFTIIGLTLVVAGLALLVVGFLLGGRAAWSAALPLGVAALLLPGLVGWGVGYVERTRQAHDVRRQHAAVQAAIDAQAREGRPIALAVRACSDEAFALHLPSNLPSSKRAFAKVVVDCVLARPESRSHEFRCRVETYTCLMPVRTARLDYGNLQESPMYVVGFEDAVDAFRRGLVTVEVPPAA